MARKLHGSDRHKMVQVLGLYVDNSY